MHSILTDNPALGIVAASFFEVREKDIADSPTVRERPNIYCFEKIIYFFATLHFFCRLLKRTNLNQK